MPDTLLPESINANMLLQGVRSDRVISLLKARLLDPTVEPERRLALVVEGGAMRGVYTGGALLGLHLLNATNVFDIAYGTSSGAVNAAHFLSGLGHLKAATYYKALADGKFFTLWRLHKVVDVDFFVDQVLWKTIPLEMERVLASKTKLMVALLNWTDARAEMVPLPGDAAAAWAVIKACVAMPVVYNRTVLIAGKRYADGGLPIPFPLLPALADGCTDLLILRSRDPRIKILPHHRIFRVLFSRLFARGKKPLVDIFDGWPDAMNHLGALAAGKLEVDRNVNIATISPAAEEVKSGTNNVPLLRRSCHQMARGVLELFKADQGELDELIAQDIV